MAAAEKMAAGIAKNAPIAVRNCKKAINDGLEVGMDEAIVIEEKLFGDCFETEDQKYGMAFFLDKNKEKVKEPFKNCYCIKFIIKIRSTYNESRYYRCGNNGFRYCTGIRHDRRI